MISELLLSIPYFFCDILHTSPVERRGSKGRYVAHIVQRSSSIGRGRKAGKLINFSGRRRLFSLCSYICTHDKVCQRYHKMLLMPFVHDKCSFYNVFVGLGQNVLKASTD